MMVGGKNLPPGRQRIIRSRNHTMATSLQNWFFQAVLVQEGVTAALDYNLWQRAVEIMRSDSKIEATGQDVDSGEDDDLLEIHHAVGEDLLNGIGM